MENNLLIAITISPVCVFHEYIFHTYLNIDVSFIIYPFPPEKSFPFSHTKETTLYNVQVKKHKFTEQRMGRE